MPPEPNISSKYWEDMDVTMHYVISVPFFNDIVIAMDSCALQRKSECLVTVLPPWDLMMKMGKAYSEHAILFCFSSVYKRSSTKTLVSCPSSDLVFYHLLLGNKETSVGYPVSLPSKTNEMVLALSKFLKAHKVPKLRRLETFGLVYDPLAHSSFMQCVFVVENTLQIKEI
jgi:hypothetical protein